MPARANRRVSTQSGRGYNKKNHKHCFDRKYAQMVLFVPTVDGDAFGSRAFSRVAGDSEFYLERECYKKGKSFKKAVEALPDEETERMWMNQTTCVRPTSAKKRIHRGIKKYANSPVKVTGAATHAIMRVVDYELYRCYKALARIMALDDKHRRSVVLPRHMSLYEYFCPLIDQEISQEALQKAYESTKGQEPVNISWNLSSRENEQFVADVEHRRERRARARKKAAAAAAAADEIV